MRRSSYFFVSVATAALLVWGSVCENIQAAGEKAKYVYSTPAGRPLLLDIYYPTTPPPPRGYPLIISFHGGGWIIGNRRNDLFLKNLTARGYALASVDYRLSGKAKYPAQINDCRESLRWLLSSAKKLQVDPDRIAVTGISAGGHLALLLAFTQDQKLHGSAGFPSHPIKAVCAFYPPTDLVAIISKEKRESSNNLVAQLLGGPVSEKLSLAIEGSPMTYLARSSPPVYLMHGDRDSIVPLDQSQRLYRGLRKYDIPSRFTVYPGEPHGFRPSSETVDSIGDFFDQHLKPIK